VRLPAKESQFVIVDGQPYVSLLWNYAAETAVPLKELAALMDDGTRGTVLGIRRLVEAELKMYLEYQQDIGHELHARLVQNETARWRRSR
jgi:hypothetical protein